jgi:fructosamine-3-kinase
VTDGTTTYFCKAASDKDMLYAEYTGVKAISDTNTIKVPTPIAYGEYQNRGFVLFEYLQFTSGGSQYQLGQKLAALHKHTSANGKFGFHIDNTIGATFQPNGWMATWDGFWDTHRLSHMLQLTNSAGYSPDKVQALRSKTRELLSHQPQGTHFS